MQYDVGYGLPDNILSDRRRATAITLPYDEAAFVVTEMPYLEVDPDAWEHDIEERITCPSGILLCVCLLMIVEYAADAPLWLKNTAYGHSPYDFHIDDFHENLIQPSRIPAMRRQGTCGFAERNS